MPLASFYYKQVFYRICYNKNIVYSEYIVTYVLKEIEFYEKFKPYKLIESGIFGNGFGMQNEFLIKIKLNISKENYFEEIIWDILNKDLT